MTGETLLNASFDVVGKQYAQGTAHGIDGLMAPNMLELLAAIAAIAVAVWLVRRASNK